jgi:hypothetical protein
MEDIPWETVQIINLSDEDILWLFRSEQNGEWYEISSIEEYFGKVDKNVIRSKETYNQGFNSYGIKITLEKGWIKYYLFNYDSVKTIPWKRICDERIILKEVTFNSWEEMEASNFEIIYP